MGGHGSWMGGGRRRGEASNGFGHFSPPIRPGPAESRLSIFNAIMSRQVWPNVPVDWERPAARPADWCPDIGAHGPADMADSFSEMEPSSPGFRDRARVFLDQRRRPSLPLVHLFLSRPTILTILLPLPLDFDPFLPHLSLPFCPLLSPFLSNLRPRAFPFHVWIYAYERGDFYV